MPTSFIDLCNITLRRLNEVEIDSSSFSSARGVQALVKDAVRHSIAKINQSEYSWPFNGSEYTQTLVVGQEEYAWPTAHKVSDWNSFQLQENSSFGISFTKLAFITLDQWLESHRDTDDAAGASGRGVPQYVFPSHNGGWGVTPSPNETYQIRFRYFLSHTTLTLFSDQSRIPTQFDNIIADGAMVQMYMFKDNPQSAQLSQAIFEQGIKQMQTQLINQYESIRDRRVVQGLNTEFFNNG
jgi:hypothetical protein